MTTSTCNTQPDHLVFIPSGASSMDLTEASVSRDLTLCSSPSPVQSETRCLQGSADSSPSSPPSDETASCIAADRPDTISEPSNCKLYKTARSMPGSVSTTSPTSPTSAMKVKPDSPSSTSSSVLGSAEQQESPRGQSSDCHSTASSEKPQQLPSQCVGQLQSDLDEDLAARLKDKQNLCQVLAIQDPAATVHTQHPGMNKKAS